MLSIASSHCILTISRDFYPKIRWWLGTETARLDLERTSRLNGGDSQVYSIIVVVTVKNAFGVMLLTIHRTRQKWDIFGEILAREYWLFTGGMVWGAHTPNFFERGYRILPNLTNSFLQISHKLSSLHSCLITKMQQIQPRLGRCFRPRLTSECLWDAASDLVWHQSASGILCKHVMRLIITLNCLINSLLCA